MKYAHFFIGAVVTAVALALGAAVWQALLVSLAVTVVLILAELSS